MIAALLRAALSVPANKNMITAGPPEAAMPEMKPPRPPVKALISGLIFPRYRHPVISKIAKKADVIVTNLKESMISEEQGDLFGPIQSGLINVEDVFELGDLATGRHPGRSTDAQITYHKNNNGTGSSEMAVAMVAYQHAVQEGRGVMIDLD